MAERELGAVLVTGGASGLGAAVVSAVAAAGGHPIVLDVAEPELGVDWEKVDVSDTTAVGDAVTRTQARHGDLSGLVTAAGIDACGRLEDVPSERWERVVGVNLLGTVAAVRAALPMLERTRGRVVTVASTLGLRAVSDASAYCASKFGVIGFTRALMAETRDRIGVTLLIPGGMETSFFDGRTEQYRPGPDAQLSCPTDVAAAVMFALRQPDGCEVREMVICPSTEGSYP